MKKSIIAVITIFILYLISSQCYAGCVSEGCYTSKGVLMSCGQSWVDEDANGVKYNCTCQCGPCDSNPSKCFPITSGGAGDGSVTQSDMNSDVEGAAFFTRNPLHALEDWERNNGEKWDAFRAMSLEKAYADAASFINSGSSGMPFNDFVYQATLKYLAENSGDSRLVRDDSKIKNATFYRGYNGASDMKLPAGFSGLDADGAYINPKKPDKPAGADENVPFDERKKSAVSSAIDTNGVVAMDSNGFDAMRDEAAKQDETPSTGKILAYKGYEYLYGKMDDKAKETFIDKLTDVLSFGNENVKSALGTAVEVVQNIDIVLKPINLYRSGDEEGLGKNLLENAKTIMAGKLKGIQSTLSKNSIKAIETISMKKLDYSINTIGSGVDTLKEGLPLR